MADGENGAAALKPFERSKLIKLPVCGKTVEVRRWAFTRMAMVNRFLNETMDALPDDLEADFKGALATFYRDAPDRLLEIAKFSIPEKDRAMLDDEEFDHLDVLAIIDAAFTLNNAGGGMGKMNGLAGRFLVEKAASQLEVSEASKPAAK
jgi:hypothetical protein